MYSHFLNFLALLLAASATPQGSERPQPWRMPNATASSHVIYSGDLEILTFETEQDYRHLQELYSATRGAKAASGVMNIRYYRSTPDGSVQPYGVWLPRAFDPARKYPLVVQLHGLNFKETLSGQRLKFRGMGERQWVEPNLPVIYAHCFGRPSTFYQGMGEEDVLEVIRETKREFPIDVDRIYIMGHSMGGAGSFTVGLHYPDLFGGIMAIDPALWSRDQPTGDMPAWMRPQVAIHSAVKLYPNARNVDVFFKNAGSGIQRSSTEFQDGIVREGGFAATEFFPGLPHNFGDRIAYGSFVAELIQHPVRRNAPEIKFYTNTLRYNRAYWVTIDRLTKDHEDARVEASYKDGALRVATVNIDALTLRPLEGPVPKGKVTAVILDDREILRDVLPEVMHFSKQGGEWRLGEWKAAALSKRHGLQGPIGDAFLSRFLAVYGEGDRELAMAELDAIRNPPGPLCIHGDFPMKAASKVTAEDVQTSNLILFGTPKSNGVLKRIAHALPAGLLRGGSIFVYPNPENPERYVVVWSARLLSSPDHGLRAGWMMPLHLLPDYVRVRDGKVESGGYFDSDWRE